MSGSVQAVVFDVNETLSDLEPLRAKLVAAGAPAHVLDTWFASTLRDGFGLAAAGTAASFRDVAAGAMRVVLHGQLHLTAPVDEIVEQVLNGMAELDLHPDAPAGLRILAAAGLRLVTLTNGSTSVSQALLSRAGLEDLFERQLSVEDAGRWKPHPMAYAYAIEQLRIPVEAICLVAAHPWDTDGAGRAGMRTAWLNRKDCPYSAALRPADVAGATPAELAARILEL